MAARKDLIEAVKSGAAKKDLLGAVKSGDKDKVKLLLQRGKYDVNSVFCGESGITFASVVSCTPLYFACKGGDLDMVRMLVSDFDADVNAYCNKSIFHTYTDTFLYPLHVAVKFTKNEVAFALINEFGADCNTVDSEGESVLHYASRKNDISLVRTLICEHKAKVNAQDRKNKTPLNVAVEFGKNEVALALINEFGADCNTVDSDGKSVLHHASRYNDISLVQTLICEHKANVNAQDRYHETPLHVAAKNGNEEVALALINEFGADCNIKGRNDQSILHYACKGGAARLMQTLICEHKADVNARDCDLITPLHVAAQKENEKVALALLNEFGADCNLKDRQDRSVLHYACRGGAASLVQTLISEHKADINACDTYKSTPLHVSANNWGDREAVVSTLIKNNASLLVADNYGNTPLHEHAQILYNIECIELLLSANAPVLSRNHQGKTSYDLADVLIKEVFKKHLQENKAELIYHGLQDDSKKKYSGSKHLTRIFVIGDPGAGKSSLIESLKREGFFQALTTVSESSVPPHTAGIIPTVHISKHYGRVLFYDFAGDREYYSSHAAILENITSSRRGVNIFIIVLDLRIEEESLTSTLHSWLLLIENQNIDVVKPSLVLVGSHKDLVSNKTVEEKIKSLKMFGELINSKFECGFSYYLLNCCKPGSKEIRDIQNHFVSLTEKSPLHDLSFEASVLLGLLEKDFSNTSICLITDLMSHIKLTGILCLPDDLKLLYPFLYELHEIGVLLLIDGSSPEEVQIIPNISMLTNQVHELLFSKESTNNISKQCKEKFGFSLNIGLVPEEMLPAGITKECLIQLQYCQEVKRQDIGVFTCIPQSSELNQSLLFFPALITSDKSDVTWTTPLAGDSYSIGWLAKCADTSRHFSPRFLHVLLLRLVFRFSLSAPTLPPSHQQTASTSLPHSLFQRGCTLWKTGVHWPMEEGVNCMVELVDNSKGVVIITRSAKHLSEKCSSMLYRIIDCVMEAKAEFCHAITPHYYLLGSTEEADDYLISENNLFSLDEVERVLASKDKECVLSISRKREMKRSQFLFVRNFTYWASLFPIDLACVLHYLKDVVKELINLGHYLNIPRGVLEAVEVAYPRDVDKWRREVVSVWMSSSQDPPCWWRLIEALKQIDKNVLAQKIEQEHSVHVWLQKKLLNESHLSVKPDDEFLELFSGVVGSKWPSIASLLPLSHSEIEEIKREGHKQDHALCMLKKWVSKEGATYGQLYQRLKSISLFTTTTSNTTE